MTHPIKSHSGIACQAFNQDRCLGAINLKTSMKQQALDLSMDLAQPLKHCSEFYDLNLRIQSIWSRKGFMRFIKQNRSFFGDAIVSFRSGIFLRESFLNRLNEWLLVNNQAI